MKYPYQMIMLLILCYTTSLQAQDTTIINRPSLLSNSGNNFVYPQANGNIYHVPQNNTKTNPAATSTTEGLLQERAVVQRAWIASAVIPGLGQIYNKQYWKIPVVYGGLVLFGYISYRQYRDYRSYSKQLYDFTATQKLKHGVQYKFIENKVKETERFRNMWMIITSFWYLINIFDAYAGANMHSFTLSNDIAVTVTPNITTNQQPSTGVGLGVALYF